MLRVVHLWFDEITTRPAGPIDSTLATVFKPDWPGTPA